VCALAGGRAFQYELNQKLAADGLSAQVSVSASDLSAGGRRRRRLTQAAGTSQLKYTIVVMVPVGRDAAEVGGAHRLRQRDLRQRAKHSTGPPIGREATPLAQPRPPPALRAPQVAQIAKAAVKAVATDRGILRRLLQLCLPADLLARLDIEALIDAMIASTVIEVDILDPSGKAPPGGAGAKTPPGMSGKSATLKITQTIPKVKASQASQHALLDKLLLG
jgi:hypothetical protein